MESENFYGDGDGSDPYRDAFMRHTADPHAALTDTQWRSVVGVLVDSQLLSRETAAQFATDYHGGRSLSGFQEQLLRWLLRPPEKDDADDQSVDDALTAMEQHTSLVERMTMATAASDNRPTAGGRVVPAFLPRALLRIQRISVQLSEEEATLLRDLHQLAHNARLFGGELPSTTATSSSNAWHFQREHAVFLQKEERRRRPLRVERHTTDAGSRVVLLESFAQQLHTARDISVWMGSATIVAADDAVLANNTNKNTKKEKEKEKKKSELVVVLSLQRRHARADEVAWLDTTVHAHRELLLSPYFQQYLGCYEALATETETRSKMGDSRGHSEHLYCFELAPITTLETLLASPCDLLFGDDDGHALVLRYFAREILLAMIDLHEQSTHTLHTRLTPQNVLLSPSRRRVLLGKLHFGPSLDVFQSGSTQIQHFLECREKELLGDLALLLFCMVFRSTLPWNLDPFRTQYLSGSAAFTSEFLLTASPSTESTVLRVCRHDRFLIRILVGGDAALWSLQSASPELDVREQRGSPVVSTTRLMDCACQHGQLLHRLESSVQPPQQPTFTFVASHPGSFRLVFVPLDRGGAFGTVTRLVVDVVADRRSFRRDPPTRLMSLIRSCSTLSLRQLRDSHSLFQPLEHESDLQALDAALERCSDV